MLEKYTILFGQHAAWLVEFKMMCAAHANEGDGPIPENLQRVAVTAIDGLKRGAILSDMDLLVDALDRLRDSVTGRHVTYPASALGQETKHLLTNMWAQLDVEHYYRVRPIDVPLFRDPEPFGVSVPELMIEDASEAAKCLALQRSTACVFHLMRVMEIAVGRLGKKLQISIADHRRETWHNIINHVNQRIEGMSTQTRQQLEKKRELATLSAHLNAVRIATRNEVMHPKQTYSLEEATEVFGQVKLFMRQFVKVVKPGR